MEKSQGFLSMFNFYFVIILGGGFIKDSNEENYNYTYVRVSPRPNLLQYCGSHES